MTRAIQTAMLSFGKSFLCDSSRRVPWVAHEGAREQLGLLQCNKRHSASYLKETFPHVDFSALPEEEDWDETKRESPRAETQRIYNYMTEVVMQRPKSELAFVGHSAWLFALFNAVVDCPGDSSLTCLFATAEIRSIQLSFYRNSAYKDTDCVR